MDQAHTTKNKPEKASGTAVKKAKVPKVNEDVNLPDLPKEFYVNDDAKKNEGKVHTGACQAVKSSFHKNTLVPVEVKDTHEKTLCKSCKNAQ